MRHVLHAQAALAAVLACTLGSTSADAAPAADPAANGLSPATAAAIADLASPTLNSPNMGRRLYLALNCYGCHGAFAEGGIGPPLAGVPRVSVEFNVMNGNEGGMPSFALYVSETDITNITNYLQTVGTDREPTFVDWWKKHPQH